LLVGLAKFAANKEALVTSTLGLAAVCNGVSVIGLYLVLRQLVTPVSQFVGLALWTHFLCMPRIMQSGMEVSLNAAACTLMLAAVLTVVSRPTAQALVVAGTAFGFAILSRIDNLFYVGFVALLLAVMAWRSKVPLLAGALCLGLPAVLLVAPYFAWNVMQFHHLMPISGRVKTYSHAIEEVNDLGGYAAMDYLQVVLGRIVEVFERVLYWTIPDSLRDALGRSDTNAALLLLLALILSGAIVLRSRAVRLDRGMAVVAVLVAASLLHVGIVVFLVGKYVVYTTWYFVWQHLLLAVVLVIVLEGLCRTLATRRRLQVLFVGVMLVGSSLTMVRTALIIASLNRAVSWPYDRNNFLQVRQDVALWLRETMASDVIVASFNAGQLGYISERRVINLDGLVNNDMLLDWHKAGKPLTDYLDRMGVQFVVDWERPLDASRRTFHHVPKESLQLLRVWEVPGPAAPERIFYAYRYLPGAAVGAVFTPFLGALEEYP
jgi:hypothetical protein